MKIRYLLPLLCMFMVVVAKNNQEIFLQGVHYQQEKNFEKALQTYEHINPKGKAVLYNMGLSYYSLNKLPYALAYLERAQQNAPMKEYLLIAQQIALINKQLGKPIASVWYTYLVSLVSNYSLFFLQFLFLLLWFLLWWRFNSFKRNYVRILFSLFFALITAGLFVKAISQRYTGGVILQEVPLRSGPKIEYDTITTLTSAERVAIVKKNEGWYLIKAGSTKGWVPAESIVVIE